MATSISRMAWNKMKKYIYSILTLCLLMTQALAQTDKNRTLATRVADVLAQFPADNAAKLDKNMNELAEMGKPGIVQIASMLTPPGKGDNSKIQYALGGFSYASTRSGKEAWRKKISKGSSSLKKATLTWEHTKLKSTICFCTK